MASEKGYIYAEDDGSIKWYFGGYTLKTDDQGDYYETLWKKKKRHAKRYDNQHELERDYFGLLYTYANNANSNIVSVSKVDVNITKH